MAGADRAIVRWCCVGGTCVRGERTLKTRSERVSQELQPGRSRLDVG